MIAWGTGEEPVVEGHLSTPAIEVPVVTVSPAAEEVTDSPDAALLQEMISDVQNEFSSKAGSLLDSTGMGQLKRGNANKADDSNRKNSAREFVSSMEKLIREHKSKASRAKAAGWILAHLMASIRCLNGNINVR